MPQWIVWCWVLTNVAYSQSLAEPLTLVRDGRPQAKIYIPAKPNGVERAAAEDLQKYIRKMTEVELSIIASDSIDSEPAES